MSMTTMGAPGNMGIPELRQILKERYRIANNVKSCLAEMKETKNSSLFGSSEYSLSQRLIDKSKALMPEMINILDKTNNNDHQKPTKATMQNSGVDLKLQRGNKVKEIKESRDYSFLMSETKEVPKVSKASPPKPSNLKSIPEAGGNGIPKKSHDKVSSLKPKKSGDDSNKSKVSSAKSESVSKDSVLVSGSESLKSRPSGNMVTKSQVSSTKRSLNPKQPELSDTKVMPKKQGPCLKKKMIKKRRVEEDLGDDGNVDFSSLIQDIMGRRGKRRYRDYGDDGDDGAMVSGFNDILKEERRSAEIARKEDAIEALRLEQEAKEERLSKAKKQKLKN